MIWSKYWFSVVKWLQLKTIQSQRAKKEFRGGFGTKPDTLVD